MDTGEGLFQEIRSKENEIEKLQKELCELENRYPDHGSIFKEGEILKIKESYFRVQRIDPQKLILKLLSKNDQRVVNYLQNILNEKCLTRH